VRGGKGEGEGVRERAVRRGRGMQKGGPEGGVRSVIPKPKWLPQYQENRGQRKLKEDFRARASKSLRSEVPE
jgi:hypothetical protein